jgi:hypothetical protein
MAGRARWVISIFHIKADLIVIMFFPGARDHPNIWTLLVLGRSSFLHTLLALWHIPYADRILFGRIARSLSRELGIRNYHKVSLSLEGRDWQQVFLHKDSQQRSSTSHFRSCSVKKVLYVLGLWSSTSSRIFSINSTISRVDLRYGAARAFVII